MNQTSYETEENVFGYLCKIFVFVIYKQKTIAQRYRLSRKQTKIKKENNNHHSSPKLISGKCKYIYTVIIWSGQFTEYKLENRTSPLVFPIDKQIIFFLIQKSKKTSCSSGRKEIFYLRLYGIRHMVKHHSDSERGNLLPPHRLLFPISSKGSFICIIPQTG